MRDRTKGLMAVGGGCCLCGLVLAGIGFAAGGVGDLAKLDEESKSKVDGKREFVQEQTALDPFTAMQIDLNDMDLEIRPSEDGQYALEYRVSTGAKSDPVSWNVENGTLKVKEKATTGFHISLDITDLADLWGSRAEEKREEDTMVLYVPQSSVFASVDLNIEDGDVYADGFDIQSGAITLNYGDATCSNGSYSQVQFDLDDGDLTGENVHLADSKVELNYGDLEWKNASLTESAFTLNDGDLTFSKTALAGAITIQNDYGDVEMKIENEAQISYQMHTDYGEIEVKENGEVKEEGASASATVEQAQAQLNVTCSDGDISLR